MALGVKPHSKENILNINFSYNGILQPNVKPISPIPPSIFYLVTPFRTATPQTISLYFSSEGKVLKMPDSGKGMSEESA